MESYLAAVVRLVSPSLATRPPAGRRTSSSAIPMPRSRQVTDLAGGDQLGHRSDGLLDGHCRVGSVLVVQIDVVDAEPAQ